MSMNCGAAAKGLDILAIAASAVADVIFLQDVWEAFDACFHRLWVHPFFGWSFPAWWGTSYIVTSYCYLFELLIEELWPMSVISGRTTCL